MITGTVDSRREAIVRLAVRGPHGQEEETEIIVDTGFTGFLLLPPDLVVELDLPFLSTVNGILADGSESVFDLHEAILLGMAGCVEYRSAQQVLTRSSA